MKKWIIGIVILSFLILTTFLYLGEYDIVLEILVIFLPFIYIGILIGSGALFYFCGKKIGADKFRKEIKKELKKLKISNPYIYFRDIPNKYGIGVSVSILRVKVTKKDVLAAVLDLCAKGYIIFKQNGKTYDIFDNKKDRFNLLKNELYLLNWVIGKTNRKFNLKEWLKLCNEDTINLG